MGSEMCIRDRDAGAAGLGQELGPEADQTAGGDHVVEAGAQPRTAPGFPLAPPAPRPEDV